MRNIGPLTLMSWGWDLKLPLGYWLTYSRIGEAIYLSLDGTPNTGIFHIRLRKFRKAIRALKDK